MVRRRSPHAIARVLEPRERGREGGLGAPSRAAGSRVRALATGAGGLRGVAVRVGGGRDAGGE